ncbi:MAG TPA: Ca2+-dependent phosphoinositide-specific phospholipase C [Acidimicrobiia bacterium]
MRDASCAAVLAATMVAVAGVPARAAAPPERLDDLHVLGTHNSYHVRPEREITPGEPADYAHAPLDVQLSKQGIGAVELDAWNAPTFPVFHSPIVDAGSTCATLERCLRTVARWSKAHPKHDPLFVYVEAKALPTNANPAVQDAIDAALAEQGITAWDAAGYDRLDALVRKVFGRTLITPDDVRGKRRTLRDAVVHDGWPTVAKSRGKVLVTLIGDPVILAAYRLGAPSLEGRPMFVNVKPDDPAASLISRDVPDAAAHIPELVQQHFIVKTRADVDGVQARANDRSRADAALASGAQIIFTDYPVADPKVGPYVVRLGGRR